MWSMGTQQCVQTITEHRAEAREGKRVLYFSGVRSLCCKNDGEGETVCRPQSFASGPHRERRRLATVDIAFDSVLDSSQHLVGHDRRGQDILLLFSVFAGGRKTSNPG